jgi:hypothetical protein
MTSEQKLGEQKGAVFTPFDLKQVRDAVRDLRASQPRSVLADLVEEKLRSIEDLHTVSRFDFAPAQRRAIFGWERSRAQMAMISMPKSEC